ncbi:WG repeat-containing protein [Flammeovirga pectinis]|uniref:WG repeat-containing protein n=1 Tax=Flammeovirga pectinis TaxID=2494373 RepID=A0A3Q9FMC9_9BACT|nr:WG repeat-containing protein [Flammeovirga pectinis]AZQ63449.1 WG repeat-containing protein [Flammeovirga pectinis]
MKIYILFLLFCLFQINKVDAQTSKLFWKFADKGEYEKIEKKLVKESDELEGNAVLNYLWGLYYVENNLKYNLDSSYLHLQEAKLNWDNADEQTHAVWVKSYVNIDSIGYWLNHVEQLAFEASMSSFKVDDFKDFIKKYPDATHIPRAIELKDSLSFEIAKKEHSYKSYQEFIKNHPEAKQRDLAQEQYEILVYHSKTKDADEHALNRFLLEHPNNKFKSKVEKQIYELRTENKSESDYLSFIRDYPNSSRVDTAITHLWYFSENKDSVLISYPNWKNISYYQSLNLAEKHTIYPVIKDSKVAFINNKGKVILEDAFLQAKKKYNCNGVQSSYIEVEKETGHGVVNRKGKVLIPFEYESISFLSEGLAVVKKQGKYGIYALNEEQWIPCMYDQIMQISNRLFGVRIKSRWGIISSDGTQKFPIEAGQLIKIAENTLLIMKKGRWNYFSESAIFSEQINSADSVFRFESYKSLEDQWFSLKEEGKWAVYSPNGEKWTDDYDLIKDAPYKQGWFIQNDTLWQLLNYDNKLKIDSLLLPVVKEQGVISRWKNKWQAFTWSGDSLGNYVADTIVFNGNGNGIVASSGGIDHLYFKGGGDLLLKSYTKWHIQYVQKDSTEEIFIGAKSKRYKKFALLNEKGNQIMTPQFTDLTVTANGFVIAKYGNWYYLYTTKGKRHFQEGYSAIYYENGVFVLKKNGKYGLYIPETNQKIAPQFDSKLIKTTIKKEEVTQWLGSKKGKKGLFSLSTIATAKFYYNDMTLFDSTSVFIREDNLWKLLNVEKNDIVLACDSYKIKTTEEGYTWILYQKNEQYGAYSIKYGNVIYPEFLSIQNIGSKEEPLFLAKQFIKQAKLYILLYINEQGNVVYQSFLNESEFNLVDCY